MRVRPFFCMLMGLLISVAVCQAQRYLFARYTPRDGLVNNRARFMYQDSRGRLYISTFGGLSVYDGSRFINYTTENGLTTSLVNDIVEMGDDSLWIIPNGRALHAMVHGIMKNLKTADNFYPVINRLLRCSDGYFYAIADDGLFRLENNRFIRISLTDSTGEKEFLNFSGAVEMNGQLFIVTDPSFNGYLGSAFLLVYNLADRKLIIADKQAVFPDKKSAPGQTAFYFLVRSPCGDILVATGAGVRKIDPEALRTGRIRLLPLPFPYQAADSIVVNNIYFDRSQNLWLSYGKEIIKISKEGKKQVFNTMNGLPAGITSSIFEDTENNMWFTNDQNGIVKLLNQQVQFYSQPRPGFTVTDMSAVRDNDSVWLYDNMQRALLLVKGNTQKLFHGIGAIPTPGHIVIGKNAYMIGGHEIYTLHFLSGQRFRAVLLYRDTAVIGENACFDRKGNLVLVSDKLTVLLGNRLFRRSVSYLADEAAVDKYNRIWTITRSHRLFVYRTDASDSGHGLELLCSWNKELPEISPRSIAVDNEGRVWVGTRDHGLYCFFFDKLRLLSWKHLTVENGLSENFINYLATDADNTVWACTPAGLDKIRYENGRFTVDNITYCNDSYQSIYKVMPSGHGIYWALVKGGYMKIGRPPERHSGYIPHVLFSQVLVENEPVTDLKQPVLTLPYDRNTVSFYPGAPSFIDETKTRYTYLLEGSHDQQWSIPSAQSAINFVNLPPGKYTLKVKAQFLTGRYPDQVGAYPFVIRPPWWQRWWFRLALAAALAAMIALAIRTYIRRKLQIQRIALEKKQAIEKERTRIATDMHDDLGADLSRIRFLSETIGIKKQRQLPIEDEIDGIREYSREMIDKMGEIVWTLNEKNDSLSDLLSYTRSYASEYLLQAGIRCTVEAPVDFPSWFVSGEFRRNVYLTIKEALHNIVKHAKAGHVCIRIEIRRDRTLSINLADDGIGFDKDHIRPFSNGLNNMQKRINDIGGILLIQHGSGTTVQLSVPV